VNGLALLFLVFFMAAVGKGWRYFLEHSDDLKLIRLLEPWYWFSFLNLCLIPLSSNYDYQFVMVGFLLQLVLSVWFAISIGWIIQGCQHKTGVLRQSWFIKGKNVKFCYRCGTRLPKDFQVHLIKDNSWQSFLFQVPPHLFEYLVFWLAQSAIVLVSLFFALRLLKKENLQHQAVLVAVVLVVLMPPAIYFVGRLGRYLTENKGLIWWDDFKNSLIAWVIALGLLGLLFHFFL
jgi:hypothetical protein